MSCTIELNKDCLNITLEEQFHIEELEAAHQQLLDNLAHASQVSIDALLCESFDTATLQWLITIREYCKSEGFNFRINAISDQAGELVHFYNVHDLLKEDHGQFAA